MTVNTHVKTITRKLITEVVEGPSGSFVVYSKFDDEETFKWAIMTDKDVKQFRFGKMKSPSDLKPSRMKTKGRYPTEGVLHISSEEVFNLLRSVNVEDSVRWSGFDKGYDKIWKPKSAANIVRIRKNVKGNIPIL